MHPNTVGTAPGCTVNGYNSQVHHATTDWKHGGTTDIDYRHPERLIGDEDGP